MLMWGCVRAGAGTGCNPRRRKVGCVCVWGGGGGDEGWGGGGAIPIIKLLLPLLRLDVLQGTDVSKNDSVTHSEFHVTCAQ